MFSYNNTFKMTKKEKDYKVYSFKTYELSEFHFELLEQIVYSLI